MPELPYIPDGASIALVLLAIIGSIMAIENLALWSHYGRGRVFDSRFSLCFSFGVSLRPIADTIFSRHVFGFISATVVVGTCLFLSGTLLSPFTMAALLTGFFFYAQIARPYGTCGADQMANILSLLLLIYFVPGQLEALKHVVLAFATMQISLAYLTTGFAKLSSREWRTGYGFAGVMHSYVYGRNALTRLLDTRPLSYRTVSWAIIMSQILTGVGILAGGWAMWLAFLCGASFHIGVAVLMRLNLFPWTFMATYPMAASFHGLGGFENLAGNLGQLL